MKKTVMKQDADGRPKLHVVSDAPPIVIKREPVEYSEETRQKLWRVLLERARERGGMAPLPEVRFYQRRSRFGVAILIVLAAAFAGLYLYQVLGR